MHRSTSSRQVKIFDEVPQPFPKPTNNSSSGHFLPSYQQDVAKQPYGALQQRGLSGDFSSPVVRSNNILSSDFDCKNFQMEARQSDLDYQEIIQDVSQQLDVAAQGNPGLQHYPYAPQFDYRDHRPLY